MPHFTVEFSKNLDKQVDIKQVLQICLDVAKTSKLFAMPSVEARAIEVPYGINIDGDVAFLHIKLALFPGRDPAQLAALCERIYQDVSSIVDLDANISTQVADIDPQFCFHN